MKRNLLRLQVRLVFRTLLLVAALTYVQARCGSDKQDPAPQSGAARNIVNKNGWEWIKLQVSPPADNISDILDFYKTLVYTTSGCRPNFYYEFKSDGSVIATTDKLCPGGFTPPQAGLQNGDTWSIKNNTITLKHADGSQNQGEVSFQNPYKDGSFEQMTWTHQEGGQTYTHVFTDR